MERVFIGVTRAEATRKADEWWGRQKGLRQTLRTEVAVADITLQYTAYLIEHLAARVSNTSSRPDNVPRE
jgi:hypothetical protein